MGWTPITHLLRAIYESDASLRLTWPLDYYELEPFGDDRRDASVFQAGQSKGALTR
jgi:hypothetical protein